MAIQPYDDCPCESGKKFRWCCQKIGKYVERAEQLTESGQIAGARQAIDEGLAVDPGNIWLSSMKVNLLLGMHEHDAAASLITSILSRRPGYAPVLLLRIHDELSHGDARAATGSMQQIIDATPPGGAEATALRMIILGRGLSQLGDSFSALAHLRAAARQKSLVEEAAEYIHGIEVDTSHRPWERDEYEFLPPPAAASGLAERWTNANALALQSRWERALAIFRAITEEQPECAAAWYNRALCEASLADYEPAAQSLERFAKLEPNVEAAVSALALAQCLDERPSAQSADLVQIRYPIRDQTRLIQRLKEHPRLLPNKLDVQNDELGEGVKDEFYLLDKDAVRDPEQATIDNLPVVVGIVRTLRRELELHFSDPVSDDPRPKDVVEAAGETIDPNGQRAVIATIPISEVRLRRVWGFPPNPKPPEFRRLRAVTNEHTRRTVWMDTPFGWLDNRTPREASRLPEFKNVLRAAMLVNEYEFELHGDTGELESFRRDLGLDPEPWLDGGDIDVTRVPLSRLRRVRAETLPAPQLKLMFERAGRFSLALAIDHAAQAIAKRPSDPNLWNHQLVFSTLIEISSLRGDRAASERWIAEARRFDAQSGGPADRPIWEVAEWRTTFQFEPTEVWASRLALLLAKFENNPDGMRELMTWLVRIGIVRLVQHPSEPNRAVLDTRILQQIVARFGTADGGVLDLSPAGGRPGKIWTPGGPAAVGESSIVLPGQEVAGKPRSKLVIPGA